MASTAAVDGGGVLVDQKLRWGLGQPRHKLRWWLARLGLLLGLNGVFDRDTSRIKTEPQPWWGVGPGGDAARSGVRSDDIAQEVGQRDTLRGGDNDGRGVN